MPRPLSCLTAVALMARIVPAIAQTSAMTPSAVSAGSSGQPIRINTSATFNLPALNPNDLDEFKRQSEAARRAMYEMVATECSVLADVFKMDCRMTNAHANTATTPRGPEAGIRVNGSAIYELWPRR